LEEVSFFPSTSEIRVIPYFPFFRTKEKLMTTAASAPPAGEKKETAEERFKRVAGLRVNKAIEAIRRVGKTGGKSTQQQQDQIVDALSTAVNKAEEDIADRRKGTPATDGPGFEFK
jgi:hypothetical protein